MTYETLYFLETAAQIICLLVTIIAARRSLSRMALVFAIEALLLFVLVAGILYSVVIPMHLAILTPARMFMDICVAAMNMAAVACMLIALAVSAGRKEWVWFVWLSTVAIIHFLASLVLGTPQTFFGQGYTWNIETLLRSLYVLPALLVYIYIYSTGRLRTSRSEHGEHEKMPVTSSTVFPLSIQDQ